MAWLRFKAEQGATPAAADLAGRLDVQTGKQRQWTTAQIDLYAPLIEMLESPEMNDEAAFVLLQDIEDKNFEIRKKRRKWIYEDEGQTPQEMKTSIAEHEAEYGVQKAAMQQAKVRGEGTAEHIEQHVTDKLEGLRARLKKIEKRTVTDLGQGSERSGLKKKLRNFFTYTSTPGTMYHTEVGGPVELRESAAGFLERFLGIQADSAKTMVFEQQGRFGLKEAFNIAANRFRDHNAELTKARQSSKIDEIINIMHKLDPSAETPARVAELKEKAQKELGQKPIMLVPNLSWPTVYDQLASKGFELVKYDVTADNIMASVETALKGIDEERLAGVYWNFPHNATGRHITPEEYKAALKPIDALNKKRAKADLPAVLSIHDDPYFAAWAKNETGVAPHLKAGYDLFFDDPVTPKIMVASGSKAFATANYGMCMVRISDHESLHGVLEDFKASAVREGGLGYAMDLMEKIREALSGEYDLDILDHLKLLEEKYKINRSTAEDAFGENVVTGGACMTTLVKVNVDEVLGRWAPCYDGEHRFIESMDDLVEYLANEWGVVVVNNSEDGEHYLRIAQAETAENFQDGVRKLVGGLNYLRDKGLTQSAYEEYLAEQKGSEFVAAFPALAPGDGGKELPPPQPSA